MCSKGLPKERTLEGRLDHRDCSIKGQGKSMQAEGAVRTLLCFKVRIKVDVAEGE